MLLMVPKPLYQSLARGNSVGLTAVQTAAEFALCIPLAQSLFGVKRLQWLFNSVAWFLSCLFLIYIASPFIIKILKRITTRAALYLVLVLSAAMIVFTAFAFGKVEEATLFDELVYASPYRRIFYVIFGMLLCLLRVDFDQKPGHKSGRFFSVLEIAAVAAGIAYFFIGNDMTGIRENLGVLAYSLNVMSTGTVLVVFSFEGGAVSKSLNSRPLQTLGGLSMYIFLFTIPSWFTGQFWECCLAFLRAQSLPFAKRLSSWPRLSASRSWLPRF